MDQRVAADREKSEEVYGMVSKDGKAGLYELLNCHHPVRKKKYLGL